MSALGLLAAAIIACDAPSVHDGDTLRCGGQSVRLFGVDAPELRRGATPAQPLAYAARDELIRLTRGRVGCRFVERDRYGRYVGRCWSDLSSDVNAAIIGAGLAKDYKRYSKGRYAKQEQQAKSKKLGIWALNP